MIEKLLLLLFFLLGVAYILLNFFPVSSLVVVDFLSLLFLLGLMEESHVGLLVHFHLNPHLLLLEDIVVPSSLRDDITGLLACLINLFVSSILLLLQKRDPIR